MVCTSCTISGPAEDRRLSSSTVSGLADLVVSTDELHMERDAAVIRCLGVDAATVHSAGLATA